VTFVVVLLFHVQNLAAITLCTAELPSKTMFNMATVWDVKPYYTYVAV